MKNIKQTVRSNSGFTIVELIVVITVVGILAAITVIAYSGIQKRATDTSVLSDLDALDALETNYAVHNNVAGKAYYSASGYDSALGFKPSSGNVIDAVINGTDYCIRGYNPNGTKNSSSNIYQKESKTGVCNILQPSGDFLGVATVTINGQVWMANNLNTGTMISTPTAQSNNSTIEKYCYNNVANNCNTYGGLYQWDEMMNYSSTEGSQGICPYGYHIPTDAEWKSLEMFLGMTQAQADATWQRGTDQGTKLKVGGSSGFNGQLYGYFDGNAFYDLNTWGGWWSSTYSSGYIARLLTSTSGAGTVERDPFQKTYAYSIRCLKN